MGFHCIIVHLVKCVGMSLDDMMQVIIKVIKIKHELRTFSSFV